MVIVRESPRKAAPQPDQQWPPKSPLDALLSSPSGRKRYEDRYNRNSVSPSPAKRRRLGAPLKTPDQSDDEDDEEDEDEETLTLKLKAIEAKLKLKKLQQKKAKSTSQSGSEQNSELTSSSRPGTAASVVRSSTNNSGISSRLGPTAGQLRPEYSRPTGSNVVVPVSPVRRARAPSPKSPARVLLGIDKGLRAQDVSLKRASSVKATASASRISSQLQRSSSVRGEPFPKGKSFAERMAESRQNATESAAKQERIQTARTGGFGVSRDIAQNAPRNQATNSAPKAPGQETGNQIKARSSGAEQPATQAETPSIQSSTDDPSTLEPFTGFHLSKRFMDHTTITRALAGKEAYSLPRLLKEVVSPDYEPPDCESDYVVFGIVASKSAPLDHRTGPPKTINSAGSDATQRTKFMVLRLTDLKWELDLYLFNTGFESFWKIPLGTVIAVLNPGILPPKVKNSGAFSLKLASSEDTVLEIGTSKDMKFCSATKADGKQCTAWIDSRKTSVCEYHIQLKVDRARKGRMEFNTMVGGGTAGTSSGGSGRGRGRGRGLRPEGKQYDNNLHETMYLAPKELGFNATRLLDDQDADVNAWQRGMSREEMQRKRSKAMEKERELASKLSALGSSTGSEYLRSKALPGSSSRPSSSSILQDAVSFEPPDPVKLGLTGKRAQDVILSTKRKRAENSGSEPMGWGGAYKRNLLMKEPLPLSSSDGAPSSVLKSAQREIDAQSPKKKARFMLVDKGIREPGRESLGGGVVGNGDKMAVDTSDEDDLEIV